MLFSPLEQFNIIKLYSFSLFHLTNSMLYAFFLIIFVLFFFWLTTKEMKLVPLVWQSFIEFYYEFILNIVKEQLGKKGNLFFPLIFVLFTFVLLSNLLGMTFYGFTTTSHISVTFCLSFAFFIGIIILGFNIQGISFLNILIPGGAPKWLLPLLVLIELISLLSRPFSLGIRLFANMMSGHTLLVILSHFTIKILNYHIILGFLPILLITSIIGLELFIAALQAYVFAVLVCIYLKDSLYGH